MSYTDDLILNSIKKSREGIEGEPDALMKSLNRSGLVQKEVQVRGKNGQVFTRKQWVKASEDQPADNSPKVSDEGEGNDRATLERKLESIKSNIKMYEKGKKDAKGASSTWYTSKLTKLNEQRREVEQQLKKMPSAQKPSETPKEKQKQSYTKATTENIYDILYNDMESYEDNPDDYTGFDLGNGKVLLAYSGGEILIGPKDSSDFFRDAERISYSKAAQLYNQTQSSKSSQKPSETSEPKKQSSDSDKFTGKSKAELWSNLKSAGYEVDAADKSSPQETITLYKNKKEFTATFNKYSDGGVEVLNIKPSETSQSSDSIDFGKRDKQALVSLLQSGKSREDIMAAAEAQGITWKKSDHAGVNWMRASMAITGTTTKRDKGKQETQPKATEKKFEDKKQPSNKTDEKKSETERTSSVKLENGAIDKQGDLIVSDKADLSNLVEEITGKDMFDFRDSALDDVEKRIKDYAHLDDYHIESMSIDNARVVGDKVHITAEVEVRLNYDDGDSDSENITTSFEVPLKRSIAHKLQPAEKDKTNDAQDYIVDDPQILDLEDADPYSEIIGENGTIFVKTRDGWVSKDFEKKLSHQEMLDMMDYIGGYLDTRGNGDTKIKPKMSKEDIRIYAQRAIM